RSPPIILIEPPTGCSRDDRGPTSETDSGRADDRLRGLSPGRPARRRAHCPCPGGQDGPAGRAPFLYFVRYGGLWRRPVQALEGQVSVRNDDRPPASLLGSFRFGFRI